MRMLRRQKNSKGHAVKRLSGLTLIELLVVIAIVGLLAATVSNRFSAALGPATLQQSISMWEFTDQQVRTRARRCGQPAELKLDISGQCLQCQFSSSQSSPAITRSLTGGTRITKFLSTTREITHGTVSIQYDERGSSETYAIEFGGWHDLRRWMLVAASIAVLLRTRAHAEAR